jgi:hypothetical protein
MEAVPISNVPMIGDFVLIGWYFRSQRGLLVLKVVQWCDRLRRGASSRQPGLPVETGVEYRDGGGIYSLGKTLQIPGVESQIHDRGRCTTGFSADRTRYAPIATE